MSQGRALLILMSSVLWGAACGQDPKPAPNILIVIDDMDEVDQGRQGPDQRADDLGLMDMSAMDLGRQDLGLQDQGMSDQGESDMGMRDGFSYRSIFEVGLNLIPGASLRVPFTLSPLLTDIELLVVRELRGYNEVINKENNRVLLKVNQASFVGPEAGADRGPLPQGSYDVFLENLGGCSGTACNDYLAVKVLSTPTAPPQVARFKGIAAQQGRVLSSGGADFVPLTVRPGHRYLARGIRGKNFMFVIAASERPKVEANQPFSAFYRWDQTIDELGPDPQELDLLPPGDYFVLMGNNAPDGRAHGCVIRIDEWEEVSP